MFLGIDCGTQGTKALLVASDGSVHGRGYASHRLIERANGAREQEPLWWVEALRTAVKQAMTGWDGLNAVRAIGVSGQQHGLVVLDEQLEVIRPAKLWNDTETAPQNGELLKRFGGSQKFLERFGIIPMTGYTVSKLLWMAEKEPKSFARIRHILLPHEYLNFWLTGETKAEAGDASGTGYFDVRTRTWCREVLDAIDGGSGQLYRALPPLSSSTEFVGALRPDAATALGLTTKCRVSAGGGDNMMGAIGTGNVREGVVTISLGTSSTVYSFSKEPAHDATGNLAPFCSSSGGWLPLVCTMNATNVVTGMVELLGRSVADIHNALETTEPGADGLLMLPFLNGERTPDLPNARGSLHGISANNFTQAHLIRAAIEGVSFGILNGLDLVLKDTRPEVILAIGGGARSRAWRQLLADATGVKIQVPNEEEAGCLGAAIQAMVAQSIADGHSRGFTEIADSIVKVKPEDTCIPRPGMRAKYDVARSAYHACLEQMFPAQTMTFDPSDNTNHSAKA
jgi:xylulokinase